MGLKHCKQQVSERKVIAQHALCWGQGSGARRAANLLSHLKIIVQAIVQDEGMCHFDAVRLHGVLVTVVIVANLWVVEVCDLRTHQLTL